MHTPPLLKEIQALAGLVLWYTFEWLDIVGMFDKALAEEMDHWFELYKLLKSSCWK